MKRLLLATILVGAASAARAECGNMVHNLIRARECEAYTSDWSKQKQLRDIRADMLGEWVAKTPLAGGTLDAVLKEADIKRSWALLRDPQIFGKDDDQWKSRGCGELPMCVNVPMPEAAPQSEVEPAERAPAPRVKRGRNRRTGGNYCGPRDTRNGYCG